LAASGARPLSFQWRLNGTNLPGATNEWLVLTNVQTNQAGVYSVLVSNPLGTVTSSEGVLTVFAPPEVNVPPHFATSSTKLFVSDGQFHLSMEGSAGTRIILETSEDLKTWIPMRTNSLPEGGMQLVVPVGANRQFFRIGM
jgi:hypothetical protein